ncbi:MAG: transglutaminase domain-containing protein [Candidatus Kapabacteria bacterium]|nr:transglutaminase domain-containing protein [Candidatus Kapabacteria bacterium]
MNRIPAYPNVPTLLQKVSDGVRKWDYGELPKGDAGIDATVGLMCELARLDYLDEIVISLARKIASSVNYEPLATAQSIYDWVVKNVTYTSDGHDEFVRAPRHIIKFDRKGDCDDMALLYVTICLATGIFKNLYFRVVAWKVENQPNNPFTHVYAMVEIPRVGVIPVDCVMDDGSNRRDGFGHEVSPILRSKIYRV